MPRPNSVDCAHCGRPTRRQEGVCQFCHRDSKKKRPTNKDYECMGEDRETLLALRKPLHGLATGM